MDMRLQPHWCHSGKHSHQSTWSLVKPQKPELPATPTQTSWGEGEVGFVQCRIGYKDDSAWFLDEGIHINNVIYPSGFNAIWKLHCTQAETCGADSPLEKLDSEVLVAPNMASCSLKVHPIVIMQVQVVWRGRGRDQKAILLDLAH